MQGRTKNIPRKRKRVKQMWICLRTKLHSRIPLLCTTRENRHRCIFTISSIPTILQLQNIGLASAGANAGLFPRGSYIIGKDITKITYIWGPTFTPLRRAVGPKYANVQMCSESKLYGKHVQVVSAGGKGYSRCCCCCCCCCCC